MRTLIAGGGTGGHLTPALAVAEALRSADEPVLLVGRRGGVAQSLADDAGIPLETLAVSGLDLSNPLSAAGFGLRLPTAIARARRVIKRFNPDVVVGAAGYVCVPVVLAARSLSIPIVLLEQNALPGRAVRMLARFAQVIATSFEVTATYLPGRHAVFTGNPVRARVLALRDRGLHETPTNLLVMGGSQGARTINRATVGCVEELLEGHSGLSVTHVTGAGDFEEVRSAAAAIKKSDLRDRYQVVDFSHEVEKLIAAADLVAMRAGGSSLAECSVLGRPMIVVPYPYAGDHQKHNAQPYVDRGAAVMIPDAEWDAPRALREIANVLDDRAKWKAMGEASRDAGSPGATDAVVELIREAATGSAFKAAG